MMADLSHAVQAASVDEVIHAAASRIAATNTAWPFLPADSHPAIKSFSDLVKKKFNKSVTKEEREQLGDYLALATCRHSWDGWRYLSAAAQSLLSGAREQAIHLAYYAELRAALSVLAGSGICINNGQNFSLAKGSTYWFKGDTHRSTWDALQAWASIGTNAERVMTCFKAYDIEAREWATACGLTKMTTPQIAEIWLNDWSIDLKSLTHDRGLRNIASYQPNLKSDSFSSLSLEDLKLIFNITRVSEYSSDGRFNQVDSAIVRDLCTKAWKTTLGKNIESLWGRLSSELAKSHLSVEDANLVVTQLKECVQGPIGSILFHAKPAQKGVSGIICRAFLLLRLSSALLRDQWQNVRAMSGKRSDTWHSVLLNCMGEWANLWEVGNPPDSIDEIDGDRAFAEELIAEWLQSSGSFSSYKAWKELPDSLITICQFERTAVLAAAL